MFGELSVLLDQPRAADVRALEASQFDIVDAATLRVDPIAVLYIATVLARRLDGADRALVALRRELQAGEPRGAIERRWKDCWAPAPPVLSMPAIPTTCSPPTHRAAEAPVARFRSSSAPLPRVDASGKCPNRQTSSRGIEPPRRRMLRELIRSSLLSPRSRTGWSRLFTGMNRICQLAIAGRLTAGSSPRGAIVSRIFRCPCGRSEARAALTKRQPWRPIVAAMLDDMRR